jgi:hypothetical protein
MNLDPRIGALNNGKFYAYVNGYQAEPVTGTLPEVEVALGLRKAAPKVCTFLVTVTPGVTSWNVQQYQVEIDARDRNEAIRRARSQYNENVGIRNNGAARFSARLVSN